jgi:DNA/RNA endonuclease G (NUC1)
MEECDSNSHTEARKNPNKRRKLPTNISDELPVQGPRKDRKESYSQANSKKRQLTAMVSLNVSKAYDICWRYNIPKKIKEWKIDENLLQ